MCHFVGKAQGTDASTSLILPCQQYRFAVSCYFLEDRRMCIFSKENRNWGCRYGPETNPLGTSNSATLSDRNRNWQSNKQTNFFFIILLFFQASSSAVLLVNHHTIVGAEWKHPQANRANQSFLCNWGDS